MVECWFRSSEYNSPLNKTINIGTGIPTKVEKLVKIISKKIPRTKYYLSRSTKGDQNSIVCDNTLLKYELRIKKFTNLEKGLEIFISSL